MTIKVDWVQHYKDRIEQIDKDIKGAIRKKEWKNISKLEVEKKMWEDKIKKLEEKQS